MKKRIRSHKDLKIWQMSMDLVDDTYKLTKSFPRDERYCLTEQMRRAAISIPSNMSEGAGRESTKEFLYFLSISTGSLSELETQFLIAQRQKYVDDIADILSKIMKIKIMINGLKNKLKSKL